MSGCCGQDVKFEGVSTAYKRALIAVIVINAGMFAVEVFGGAIAGSMALAADSLDFLADSATYAISLAVIGLPLATRAKAALFKGGSLALMGLGVFGLTVYELFTIGVPNAAMMSGLAVLTQRCDQQRGRGDRGRGGLVDRHRLARRDRGVHHVRTVPEIGGQHPAPVDGGTA